MFQHRIQHMFRLIILIASAALMLAALMGCVNDGGPDDTEDSSGRDEPVSAELFAMDTYMTLTAYGENAEKALSESEKEIRRLDAMLSAESEESEISGLNKAGKKQVSEETFGLIKRAAEIGEDTGGAFDITIYPVMQAWGFAGQNYRVPEKAELEELLEHVDVRGIKLDEDDLTVSLGDDMAIDLGGIAKGYTSDRIIAIMKESGVEHALVNLGGNVQVLGHKPDGSEWRVAITDPEDEANYVGGVSVSDKAVITSGGYQRFFESGGEKYFHIIDPSDGYPARNGLISVTIVSEDGTLADGLSTSLFIMGPDKACDYWRKNADDFDAVLVTDDGSVLVTEGLEDSWFSDREYEIIRK
ncbi:MAG: FAD:protein FMN transferase [Eubacterium sp.]|nr:FAD:protein FMN transferase [Eubacterium sp.]